MSLALSWIVGAPIWMRQQSEEEVDSCLTEVAWYRQGPLDLPCWSCLDPQMSLGQCLPDSERAQRILQVLGLGKVAGSQMLQGLHLVLTCLHSLCFTFHWLQIHPAYMHTRILVQIQWLAYTSIKQHPRYMVVQQHDLCLSCGHCHNNACMLQT